MAKDYLNSDEKSTIITLLKTLDAFESIMQGNLFTKEEKTNLKRGITYISKGILGKEVDGKFEGGMLPRLNLSAAKSFNNSLHKLKIFASDQSEIDAYSKRISSKLEEGYEVNKDFFNLVELVMHYNCKECVKCGSDCLFYKFFEDKAIPEFGDVKRGSNCKYSYRLEFKKEQNKK
jgi:hypothetical protein